MKLFPHLSSSWRDVNISKWASWFVKEDVRQTDNWHWGPGLVSTPDIMTSIVDTINIKVIIPV